ncbi:MAG: hypothetical protein F4Y88_00235 [Chloroflexi bacterium]|nr:hypothetical protein [Chloroflexota bacterium]
MVASIAVATLAAVVPMSLFAMLRKPLGHVFSRVNWPETSAKLNAVIAICLLLIVIGFLIGMDRLEQSRIRAASDAALQQFDVTTYGEDLDISRFDRTLAEFEWARNRISSEMPATHFKTPIDLHIFETLNDYHIGTGRPLSAGSMVCDAEGAVVFVPLEEAIDPLAENDSTQTPVHEMAHAMLCHTIGRTAFYSVPLWFHEGFAQIYENEGRQKRIYRIGNRSIVWLKRHDLMKPEEFCHFRFGGSHSEIRMFYRTSMEFVRYLKHYHGHQGLLALIDDVRQGTAFTESLAVRFGGTCETLYAGWLASWR